MRAVQTRRYLYLFNPWSNGERNMATATKGTMTYRRMKQLAPSDPAIAARLHLIDHRVLEEFYNVENDPDCLKNLIDNPALKGDIDQLRISLEEWMVKTSDPLLDVFRNLHDAAYREAYMKKVEAESAARRKSKRRKQRKARIK